MRLILLGATLDWLEGHEPPNGVHILGWTKRPSFLPTEFWLILTLKIQVKIWFISKTWEVALAYGVLNSPPNWLLALAHNFPMEV